ncbi:LYP1 [[Candida] subhashii]|uniref:LYP1 n=1 Tax=[Candida] subhashii TaxID=561895 RepID=A0A8J5UTP0_9ASCO|nr:LYP1 [[Candida] subhashii]KAG7665642.1 LYP1 [[Candida] subhashii]
MSQKVPRDNTSSPDPVLDKEKSPVFVRSILAKSGPASALISFLFVGSLVISLTYSLGEMATLIPVSGSFLQFVTRFCSPALGAANGWSYWFSWAITYALELSIVGRIVQYWTDAVPLWAWITMTYVGLTALNLFPVRYYGEVEFWMAAIKVFALLVFLLYAFIIVCGAGQTGPIGFRYWRNPGAFGPGILVENQNTARFLGWLSSLVNAVFTFQGTELVGIAAGEASNPRKTVPAAITKVLYRILIFFIGSIIFLGMLVPYDDARLEGDSQDTRTSPFIIAMNLAGTKVLPDIFNAVILTTILSAGNSNVYSGSRIMYGLAESGVAPKFFLHTTKKGVPYVAVLFTALFGSLGYLALDSRGKGTEAFDWLLNISATAGMISWGLISCTHIRFMHILRSRNISRDSLPYKVPFMPYGAYYAAIAVFIAVFVQGFEVFFEFNVEDFFIYYISLIFFVVAYIFFYIFFYVTKAQTAFLIPYDECDIDTGAREIDEMVFDDTPPKNLWEKFWYWVS